ncbi:DUF5625 family protein [Paraburkholderia gardini]|uniref:DUF5625 family protein n=1 Tax=Paraburkholderia gardini TaxID=2823469 RepID=UPI001E4E13E6|nr:DUF5625 family protein [Paraburkholderia gardini]
MPISVPFNLATSGNDVSVNFVVDKEFFCAVNLKYFFQSENPADRERVWALVGGMKMSGTAFDERGAPVTVRVSIWKILGEDESLLTEQIVSSPRLSSWGQTLNARLMLIKLEPGRYVIRASTLLGAPQLSKVETQLSVVQAYLGK